MTSILLMTWCCQLLSGSDERAGLSTDTLLSKSDRALERIIELRTEDEADPGSLLDVLTALQEHPLDINKATEEELEQIPGIDPVCAQAIVAHRDKHPMRNLDDLLAVAGVTPELIDQVKPFLVIQSRNRDFPKKRTHVKFRSREVTDNVQGRSAASLRYPGSLMKLQTRLTVDYGLSDGPEVDDGSGHSGTSAKISIGLATEKQPGEKDYLDCVSGYAGVDIPGSSVRIVIGTYAVESGKGLMFGRGTGLSKGSDVIGNAVTGGAGIRPSLSMDQSRNLRGAAISWSGKGMTGSLFYSSKREDAAADLNGEIIRFDADGLHRTAVELEQRDRVAEKLIGSRVSVDPVNGMRLGLSFVRARWDVPIRLSGPFAFHGREAEAVAADISATWSKGSLFSEIMSSWHGAVGGVGGILFRPGSSADVAILVRQYPVGLFSPYGSAFSEASGGSQNEKGVYMAFSFRPAPWMRFDAFLDQFAFPWRTGGSQFSSSGSETFLALEGRPTKTLTLELVVRSKTKPATVTSPQTDGFDQREDCSREQQNLRFVLCYSPDKSFAWKSRVERVWVLISKAGLKEGGMLVYQDFSFALCSELRTNVRFVAFETESYESRLYEFESEVPGAYLSPGLSGRGFRWYVGAQWTGSGWINLSAKFSQTVHDGKPRLLLQPAAPAYDFDNRLIAQIDIHF